MKNKILLGLGILIFAGASYVAATGAFFSDTETSTGNTFTAGAIDLKVDSTQHYNGHECIVNTTNHLQPEPASYVWGPGNNPFPVEGTPCGGTWALKDLSPTSDQFFNFGDVKPGDSGEDTISLHVINNDAWVCAAVSNLTNADNSTTEPESSAAGNTAGGDLQQTMVWKVWKDDGEGAGGVAGDNIQNGTEPTLTEGHPQNGVLALYDSTTGGGPLGAASTTFLGVSWSLPASSGNETQTDSMKGDISFQVEQSRNNGHFVCGQSQEQRPKVGAANYVAGTPTCNITVNATGGDPTRDTIQEGVNLATEGQTVCVAGGNYNEFTVNKALTVRGLNDPEGGSAAIVKPSNSSVTALALVTASNVTITGLQFDGSGTTLTGQSSGVQISPVTGNLSNVNITYNVIKNIATATGSAAKGIQWWTAGGSGFSLNNSNFKHNTISDISAVNKGGYGVQTVGAMSNVAIENNTISNTSGAWGAGVAVDTNDATLTAMSGNTISFNQIMTNVSGTGRVAVQVENRVNATGVAVHQNNIETLLYGGGNGVLGTEGTLNAENNWFGTATPAVGTDVFLAPGTNVADFNPFEASAFATN